MDIYSYSLILLTGCFLALAVNALRLHNQDRYRLWSFNIMLIALDLLAIVIVLILYLI